MTVDDRTFRTARTMAHSAETVYAAFASPQWLAAWWGPEGFSNTFGVCEFVPGGLWRFDMHAPDGATYANRNVFVELEPARRVVIRHDGPPYFTLTITLSPTSGGARIEWEQTFDDAETARSVASVVVPANEQNLDRLERVLATVSIDGSLDPMPPLA